MSAEKPLLHIRNLSVTYMAANPPVTAVSDISLQVHRVGSGSYFIEFATFFSSSKEILLVSLNR
jgi:hypothetical protein